MISKGSAAPLASGVAPLMADTEGDAADDAVTITLEPFSAGEAGLDDDVGRTTPWQAVLLVAISALGVIVLAAMAITLTAADRRRDQALRLQSHSYDVMILARALSGTIAQSEASLGRYVISGDRTLGRRYFGDWQLAGQQINRLDQVTGDDAQQQRQITALRRAYATRGEELSLIALSTNYGKNSQALARYYQARDSSSLSRIDALLDAITAREAAQLDTRTADALRSIVRSNLVAGLLAVLGLAIVLGAIGLGWLTVQTIGERGAARADADAERLRAEELERAVGDATAELREQETRLRQAQKMDALGQLTGGIAHDFNNMLSVVLGGLELARRHLDDPGTARRYIDNALEGADRATALTRRLLAFSRNETLSFEPLDPATLIAGMSDLIDRTLGDAVTIEVRDASMGWHVQADRSQLESGILNLAVNARDAMAGRGRLTIATGCATLTANEVTGCRAGDYVRIAVTDTGCGMTAEIVERVFEPFFTTKPIGRGTGLGLSQVFAFVRQAEGAVEIDSKPQLGTTVSLLLPRSTELPIPTAAARPAAEAGRSPGIDILVVEDDPRVLAATTAALAELGHRPWSCSDPLTAPALLESVGTVGLIVSDVLMPDRTGPEMIAGLAQRHRQIPVLYVTGFAGDAGADAAPINHHVLRKPFTIAALAAAIDAACVDRSIIAPVISSADGLRSGLADRPT